MTGNDKLRKENQALRNYEIEELKNKVEKVSDDLSKNQHGRHAKRRLSPVLISSLEVVFYSFLVPSARLSNSLRFLFLLVYLYYSCTCLAPPRLAFQLQCICGGKPSNCCIFVQRIKLLLLILLNSPR